MEHRKCVRHIYGNLKKKHGNKKQMKSYIWSVAWSYNEAKYQQNLDMLSCYDTGVYTDVMATNPKSWCRAFFKLGNYCEDVENNSTESFNSSINKAREKPFVHMLETIARLAMVRIATRSRESHEHQGKFFSILLISKNINSVNLIGSLFVRKMYTICAESSR